MPSLGFVVLVVEDELLTRFDVATAFEASGCTVLEANSGASALELCESDTQVDALVTDINLGNGRPAGTWRRRSGGAPRFPWSTPPATPTTRSAACRRVASWRSRAAHSRSSRRVCDCVRASDGSRPNAMRPVRQARPRVRADSALR